MNVFRSSSEGLEELLLFIELHKTRSEIAGGVLR